VKAYSKDLHQKILEAVLEDRGTQQEIADFFGVSQPLVSIIARKHAAGEPVGPKPGHVGSPKLKAEHQAVLRELLAEQNDLTLDELRERLHERGAPLVSRAAMGKTLTRMGLPRKKSRSTPVSETRRG
jgi:transposase